MTGVPSVDERSPYIEFVGPPGVGKSTVHGHVVGEVPYYGGLPGEVCRRLIDDMENTFYSLLPRLTPPSIWNRVSDCVLKYKFGRRPFSEFVFQNPDYVPTITELSREIGRESEHLYRICEWTAKRYQMGASTAREDEIYCTHEGFVQKAVGVAWRSDRPLHDAHQFLESCPTPSVLVHLTADADVCLERQRERGRLLVDKPWGGNEIDSLRSISSYCSQLSAKLSDDGTRVIKVENVGDPESVANDITGCLQSISFEQ